jgi:hypothetical protein
VPEMQDYLDLASEADDLAAWMPDSELAASYHRLAESYQELARFHDRISALLNVRGERFPATRKDRYCETGSQHTSNCYGIGRRGMQSPAGPQ